MTAKRKLLVILGAGSSVEQDFPTTEELDDEVKKWALDFVTKMEPETIDAYTTRTHADYFALLWTNRENYCADLDPGLRAIAEPRTKPNYERVLGDLHALMNGVLSKPYGDPILKWIPKADVFAHLGIVPDSSDLDSHGSSKVFHAVQGQLHYLCAQLAERIRGNSQLFELELSNGRGKEQFEPYRALFDGLSQEFEIGVYNLNYDTVALNALPKAFVGFNRKLGEFLPAKVLNRGDWGFLYHLHGSVHHRVKVDSRETEHKDFGLKVVWHEDLSQQGEGEDWQDVKDLMTGADGKRFLPTSLIAGGWKLDQLQEEPFLTLYSTLPRHAYEADAVLIGGYGFGDPHINSILKHAIRSKANGPGRPPVLVLTHNKDGPPTAKRGGPWTIAMGQTLRAAPQRFRSPQFRTQDHWTELPDTVSPGEFEQSLKVPVAIWNDGFLSSSQKLNQIVKWLSGDQSAL